MSFLNTKNDLRNEVEFKIPQSNKCRLSLKILYDKEKLEKKN